MSLALKRGTTKTCWCPFVSMDNQEPISIVNPIITIRHVDSSGTLITDVDEEPLTFAVENLYYFKWAISLTAFIGEYNVECEAIVNGELIEHNMTWQVID